MIGSALAFLVTIIVKSVMSGFTGFVPDFTPDTKFIPSVCLGIIVPVVASVVPIRRALRSSLRDSLDLYHSSSQNTNVIVTRLEELGLAGWQTSIALLMIVTGFMVYYVVPLAFLFNSLPLFFGVLNLILMGMLIGLCLISQVSDLCNVLQHCPSLFEYTSPFNLPQPWPVWPLCAPPNSSGVSCTLSNSLPDPL